MAPGPSQIAGVTRAADVERHLRRRGGAPWSPWKAWGERRVLERCLGSVADVRSVCDCPCGPGRLFPLWRRHGLRVIGVDTSEVAVEAAREALERSGGTGHVIQGDAAALPELLEARADLVACIRFLYYFDRERRIALLRGLAAASRRYVLAQYRTTETWRARRNARRGRGRGKHAGSTAEIREELCAAGLEPLRIEPIGPLSDRVFALCRKRTAAEPTGPGTRTSTAPRR